MKLRTFFFIMFLIIGIIALVIVSLVSMKILDENTYGTLGIALLFTSLLFLYLALRGKMPEEDDSKTKKQKTPKTLHILRQALNVDTDSPSEIISDIAKQILENGYEHMQYEISAENVESLEYYRFYPDESSVMMVVVLSGEGINEGVIEQCILDQPDIYENNTAVNDTNRKNMIMILIPNRYNETIESYIEDGTIIDYETSIITVGIDIDNRQVYISPKDYTGTKKWNESINELKRIIPII